MEAIKLIYELGKQLTIHNNICDRIFKERFSRSKHEDSWNDSLFKEYQKSKNRLELTIELLESVD